MGIITPTTELDAVNTILSGIGESPVNSLTGETTTDVSLARSVLLEISRDVQLEGWTWNTEHDYPLSVDDNKEIRLPPAALRVEFRYPDSRLYTVRGNRLYDLKNHSFLFPDHVTVQGCSVVFMLSFHELPEAARRYTTLKSLRVFQERTVGSQVLSGFQRDDENRCRGMLMAEERKAGRHNMLQGVTAPNGMGWQTHTVMQRTV